MRNIKGKLIVGFLSVVAIFAVGAGIAGTGAKQAATEVQLFLDEYWPTSALLMETNIVLDEIAARTMNPPPDSEPSDMIDDARTELDEIQQRFKTSGLAPADIDRIVGRIELFKETIALPAMLHSIPGERMEAADTAAGPLLDQMGNEQDFDLLNATWEAVMSFNDILITRDSAERENYRKQIALIESHPGFERFRPEYETFKGEADQVFDSAIQLENARKFFQSSFGSLTEELRETGARYAETVVQPASVKIHDSLNLILSTMLWATLISALLSVWRWREAWEIRFAA